MCPAKRHRSSAHAFSMQHMHDMENTTISVCCGVSQTISSPAAQPPQPPPATSLKTDRQQHDQHYHAAPLHHYARIIYIATARCSTTSPSPTNRFFVVRSLCSALLMYFPLSLALSVTLSVSCVSLSQLNCRSLVNFFGPAVPVPSQCQCWLHPAEMHHLNPWDLRFM